MGTSIIKRWKPMFLPLRNKHFKIETEDACKPDIDPQRPLHF